MSKINLFKVNSASVSSVLQEYHQTEESLNEDVAALKKWMKEQPHFPEILDDKPLQNFLIMNKCSLERAKERIDMYYTLRTQIPELLRQNDVNNFIKVLDIVHFCPLPNLTPENYRIFCFKIRNSAMIHHLDPYELTKLAMYGQEIRLKEDVMFGDVFIFDLSGPIFELIKKITPTFLAKTHTLYEKIWSMRIKGVYIINSHPLVSKVLAIIKVLAKPKIFKRFHVCQNSKILENLLPKKSLPRDYGGEEKYLEEIHDMMVQKIHQHKERLFELNTLETDENLRPEKLENDEHLGFYGNFKKINVD